MFRKGAFLSFVNNQKRSTGKRPVLLFVIKLNIFYFAVEALK